MSPATFEVHVSGAGQPVLFIPGFACPGSVWDDTVAHLDTRVESHVITFAGFAGVPPVARPSLADMHAELVRYLDGLERPVVVGHSLGGTMALWLAETVPGLGGVLSIDGLPFAGGGTDPDLTEERVFAELQPVADGLRAMSTDELGAWIRETMSGMFTREQDRERVLAECAKSDVTTVATLFREGMARNLRPGLPDIAVPVTVVVSVAPGKDETGHIDRWRTEMAPIPDHDVVFMEGSHFVMYDQPQEFNATVDRVIARSA